MIDSAIQALMVLLPCGYLVVALLYGMAFAGVTEPPFSAIRTPLLRALSLAHLGLFALHGAALGGFPAMDAWLSLSAVAFAVVAQFVLVTLRLPQPTVGALVLAVAGMLQLVASMFGPMAPLAGESPSSAPTAIHALTAAFASAAVVLSGLYGFLYLILLRQMKRKTFGALFRRLPDLTQLARMTRRAALAGFLGMTLGVNAGIGLAHAKGTAGFQYTDPTVLLTLGVWLHFGLIAFSAKLAGLTAQRASWAAVCGLTVLLAVLFLALVPGATFHGAR